MTGRALSSLNQDLLVPAMHSPDTLRASPLMGKAPVPRTRLAIFKGRMQVGKDSLKQRELKA